MLLTYEPLAVLWTDVMLGHLRNLKPILHFTWIGEPFLLS